MPTFSVRPDEVYVITQAQLATAPQSILAEAAACASSADEVIDLSSCPTRHARVFKVGRLPRLDCKCNPNLHAILNMLHWQAVVLCFTPGADIEGLEAAAKADVVEALSYFNIEVRSSFSRDWQRQQVQP